MMQLITDDDKQKETLILRCQSIRPLLERRNGIYKPSPSNPPSAVQLPLWAETQRCLPNEIVRSALFNARNRKQPRIQLKEAEIAVIGDGRITYTGEELRQDDETVWLQLIHMAKERPLGHVIEFTPYSLCKAIGWSNDSRSYQRLRESLKRMQATSLEISSKRLKAAVSLSMIPMFNWRDNDTGQALRFYQVEVAPKLVELFGHKVHNTRLGWSQRLALPVGIATWLHTYYHSHEAPYPLKLETIKEGAGITMQPKHLRTKVKQALEELKRVGFLSSGNINGELVSVIRTGTRNLAC